MGRGKEEKEGKEKEQGLHWVASIVPPSNATVSPGCFFECSIFVMAASPSDTRYREFGETLGETCAVCASGSFVATLIYSLSDRVMLLQVQQHVDHGVFWPGSNRSNVGVCSIWRCLWQ